MSLCILVSGSACKNHVYAHVSLSMLLHSASACKSTLQAGQGCGWQGSGWQGCGWQGRAGAGRAAGQGRPHGAAIPAT